MWMALKPTRLHKTTKRMNGKRSRDGAFGPPLFEGQGDEKESAEETEAASEAGGRPRASGGKQSSVPWGRERSPVPSAADRLDKMRTEVTR